MKYENEFSNGWKFGPGLCGSGSKPEITIQSREKRDDVIQKWIDEFGTLPVILEIGCGDLLWHDYEKPECEKYIGIDLHRRDSWQKWEEEGCKFMEADASKTILPHADIAIARFVFIHLSNRAIEAILTRLLDAGVQWLFATSVAGTVNEDRFAQGRFDPEMDYSMFGMLVDLEASPFNLFAQEIKLEEHPSDVLFDLSQK